MRFASSKSFAVRPPSECVVIVTRTSFQEMLDVRVVAHVLGGLDELVDELDRADEVAALERLGDRVAVALPAVELAELRGDLVVVEACHACADMERGSARADVMLWHSGAMRIASLVPSATEMLFALGLGDSVVAVTHECDFPPEAESRPRLTRSVIPEGLPPGEIDAAVREVTGEGRALYELDEAALAQLDVDLIVTQALCAVCAVSYDDVRAVAARLPSHAARCSRSTPRRSPRCSATSIDARRRDRRPGARPGSCGADLERAPRRGRARRSPAPRARASLRSSGSTRRSPAAIGSRR